jgi:hypothetical protein
MLQLANRYLRTQVAGVWLLDPPGGRRRRGSVGLRFNAYLGGVLQE